MEHEHEYLLDVPFDTAQQEVVIFQGQHGTLSHRVWEHPRLPTAFDLSHAIDFALPLGTIVRAPFDGRVTSFIDSAEGCYRGLDPALGFNVGTNFISIVGEDGYRVVLSHLAARSIIPSIEDRVWAGEGIARTGRSGWIGPMPHLHVHVDHPKKFRGVSMSVPMRFKGYEEPTEDGDVVQLMLQHSEKYRAVLEARGLV